MKEIFLSSEFFLVGGALLFIATKFIPGVFLRMSAWNFFSLASLIVHPENLGIKENFLLYLTGGISFFTAILIASGKIDYVFSIILSLAIQEIFFRGFLLEFFLHNGLANFSAAILTAIISTFSLALQLDFKGLSAKDWRLGIFLFAWAACSGYLRIHFESVLASVLFFLALVFLLVLYLFLHP